MPRKDPFLSSRLRDSTEIRRVEAYLATGSDGEAARLLGLATSAFSAWRVRRGFPARHAPPGERVLAKAEHERRLAAYREHPTDGAAADELGIPRRTFRAWREYAGLDAKRARSARVGAGEERRRQRAYRDCATDAEAAKRLGIGVGAFKTWRQERGLAGKGSGGLTVAEDEDARRRVAYEESANDIEAAARVGMTTSGFQRWRAKAGLPAKTPTRGLRVTPREQATRMRSYAAGDSDAKTAKRLGLTLAAYRGWRQAQGLPARRRPLRTD